MAAPKGHPRWRGKQKGSKHHATRLREQAITQALIAEHLTPADAEALQPLPVMLRVMRARALAGDDAGALAAAQAAAPYCHARLSSSDVHVSGSLSTQSDEGIAEALAELEQKLQAAHVTERRAGIRLIEHEADPSEP